jgi:hypothetical protein
MEATDFLLGMCTGAMAMLIAVLRVIANTHNRRGAERGRR